MLNTCENSLHFTSTLGLEAFRKLASNFLFLDKQGMFGDTLGLIPPSLPCGFQRCDAMQRERPGWRDVPRDAGGSGEGPPVPEMGISFLLHRTWPSGSSAAIFRLFNGCLRVKRKRFSFWVLKGRYFERPWFWDLPLLFDTCQIRRWEWRRSQSSLRVPFSVRVLPLLGWFVCLLFKILAS